MEMKDKETYCNLKDKQADIEEEKELSSQDDASSLNDKTNNEPSALLKSEKIFYSKLDELNKNSEFCDLANDFILALNSNNLDEDKFDSYCKRLIGVVGHHYYRPILGYIHDCARYRLVEKVLALPRNFNFVKKICGNIIQRPDRTEMKISKDFIKKMQRKYRDRAYMLQDSDHDRIQQIAGKLWY
jgi:hypothetical protein